MEVMSVEKIKAERTYQYGEEAGHKTLPPRQPVDNSLHVSKGSIAGILDFIASQN